jgi:NIMA (never in mitosis gene a)-related kinase
MENFEIISKLGDGAYSVVYKVKRKQDNKIYALKKVKLKDLCDKEKQNALNEVRILASVKSNFVISYKEAFIDEDDTNLCLIMEYADKGDLYQKISQFKKIGCLIEEIDIWRIFIQMVKGLKALHDLNILHRDLKSANIFLFGDGTAKIGDLNVSKVINKGVGYTQTGTPYYASPEVWNDQPYDIKSDIWSLGCVTFEMLALKPPFRAENMDKLYNKVIKGEYSKISDRYSDDMKTIIKLLLKVNPKERPNCAQILNHDIIKKRLEFFQAQTGFEDDLDTNDEGVLLKTIKIPKNIIFLTEKLPGAKYDTDNKNRFIKKINKDENKKDNSNNDISNVNINKKKMTFPSNLLPDIKFNFDNKNNKMNVKNNNLNDLDNEKNENDITGINININKDKIIDKKININKDDNNTNSTLDIDKTKRDKILDNKDLNENIKKVKEKQMVKRILNLGHKNKSTKLDYFNLKINYLSKKNNSSSKKNILYRENSKRDLLNNKYSSQSNSNNKIKITSREKKEHSYANLNSKLECNINNDINPKIQQDDFFKYLKSIGLGDMYKLCVPNYIENNTMKNYNNRYKFGTKKTNCLSNINNITNKNVKNNIDQDNKNKIIPNKRLVPLGNRII